MFSGLKNRGFMAGERQFTTSRGQAYYWYYKPRGRRSPPRSVLSIVADLPVDFSVVREGMGKRLAKWLGFATEFQTSDLHFDSAYYIFSDDTQFCNLLRSADIRRHVHAAFEAGMETLKAEQGKMMAEMAKPKPAPDPGQADVIVEALQEIRRQAAALPLNDMRRACKSKTLRAHVAIWGIIGALVAAVIGLAMQPYKMLDYERIVWDALPYAAIVTVLMFFIIRALFQGSSRGVTVFGAFVFAGLPAIAFGSYLTLYTINYRYDDSEATLRAQRITDMKTKKSRKSRMRYYLYTDNWLQPHSPLRFSVDSALYRRTRRNDFIRMAVHPGKLGYEWIENFRVSAH